MGNAPKRREGYRWAGREESWRKPTSNRSSLCPSHQLKWVKRGRGSTSRGQLLMSCCCLVIPWGDVGYYSYSAGPPLRPLPPPPPPFNPSLPPNHCNSYHLLPPSLPLLFLTVSLTLRLSPLPITKHTTRLWFPSPPLNPPSHSYFLSLQHTAVHLFPTSFSFTRFPLTLCIFPHFTPMHCNLSLPLSFPHPQSPSPPTHKNSSIALPKFFLHSFFSRSQAPYGPYILPCIIVFNKPPEGMAITVSNPTPSSLPVSFALSTLGSNGECIAWSS